MTFDEFMAYVVKHFPEGTVGEDGDGQLIINTNVVNDRGHILCLHDGETNFVDCPFGPKIALLGPDGK